MASVASSAPEILIGHIAGATTTLRVGSGGIMLPNHAPLHVAEVFHTLETLYPDRIDLGIGRAPGHRSATSRALRPFDSAEFPNQVPRRCARCRRSGFPPTTPLPRSAWCRPTWRCRPSGCWRRAARPRRWPGSMGLGYAFARHFSPHAARSGHQGVP
jgi:luciferase family oxidoreductase group 1